MKGYLVSVGFGVVTALAAATGAWAQATCPPQAWSLPALQQLKAAQWKLADAPSRDALALALLPCLADANPALRDGIAFEGLSAWLRAKQLSVGTMQQLHRALLAQLADATTDSAGFARPFAALVLSELARADRLQPFLTDPERQALVDAASTYLRGVRDYRGFIPGEGWRHGVAHGADLAMQLALNPALNAAQLDELVLAVQTQIAPAGEHFYIYGEGERLARPIYYAARRGLITPQCWEALVQAVASPAPLPSWDRAFESQVGLARLHNVKAFLLVLSHNVAGSADPAVQAALGKLLPPALKQLP